jgi:hypothetical protein
MSLLLYVTWHFQFISLFCIHGILTIMWYEDALLWSCLFRFLNVSGMI